MKERVRPALAIPLRSAGAGEAHAFVEGDGAFILFIDVGRHGRMEGEAVIDERAAYAFAVPRRVDEEGVHVRAVDQHEADRAVIGIGGEPCGGLRQEAGHFRIDRLAVGGIEEIMGCVDGAAPDVEQASAIGGAGGADRYHGRHIGTQRSRRKGA